MKYNVFILENGKIAASHQVEDVNIGMARAKYQYKLKRGQTIEALEIKDESIHVGYWKSIAKWKASVENGKLGGRGRKRNNH